MATGHGTISVKAACVPQESKLEQDVWAWLLPWGREVTGKQTSGGLDGDIWARGE